MKKVLYILITIIIVSGLLISGCSKESTTTTAPATTPTKTTTTAPTQTTTTAPASTSTATVKPTSTTPAAGQPVRGGTLTVISTVMPQQIGYPPEFAAEEGQTWPFYAESLGEATSDPAAIDPLLATSWDEDIAAKTLTVHLRKGVKFQDDTDFNAEAVKWNYQLAVDNKMGTLWTILKSIDVLDENTIRFSFNEYPYDTARTLLVGGTPIFSPTSIQTHDKKWAYSHAVTTGPFMVTDFQQDISFTLKKFNNYWNKGYPYLDGIVWKRITDVVTCAATMIAGEGDIWQVLANPTIKEDMVKKGIVYHHTGPVQLTYWYLYPDTKPDSIFNDIRVRQAVSAAIDNKALCQAVGGDMFIPLNQLVCPGLYAYNPEYKGITHDLAKAKQLLADAGFPNGIHTKLSYESTQGDEASAIQAMLAEANITVDLVPLTQSAWFPQLFFMGWDGLMLAFNATGNDMWCVTSFNEWLGPHRSVPFLIRAWSPAVLDLLNKGMYTFDNEARKTIGQQLLTAAADEMNVIPIWGAPLTEYCQPWVHSNQFAEGGNGTGQHIWRAWKEKH